jgi:hypothetical protein
MGKERKREERKMETGMAGKGKGKCQRGRRPWLGGERGEGEQAEKGGEESKSELAVVAGCRLGH